MLMLVERKRHDNGSGEMGKIYFNLMSAFGRSPTGILCWILMQKSQTL
jgi:hypothetical protein